MPFGFFTSRLFPQGPLLRPLGAAICLVLATQANAGWFSNKEKKNDDASAAAKVEEAYSSGSISTLEAANSDTSHPTAAADDKNSQAAPDNLDEADLGNGESVDEEEVAAADDDEEADDTVLPHVEESELGTVDSDEARYSAEELAALGDLWTRMRHGFQMDTSIDNERIAVQRNWYLRNADYLDRMARRASRYLHYTVSEAEKRNLPTELALLPIIESAYDPFAYSHANAAGMWQFIPGTARIMGLKLNDWFDGRRDVIDSTRAAYDFLSLLYGKFGDWQLALAAYNAGPGAVQRAINRNKAAGLPTDFWSLKLPAETRAYVPRFLAMAQIVKSPESFGVTLHPVVNQPFFRVITINGQVDLPEAASIAGISLKEMYQLNAGFKRQATDPAGPHRLLVPAALPQDFEADIAALQPPEMTVAQTYTVRKGDSLYQVARRFNMQPADIKRLNNLKSNNLIAGRTLVITQANHNPEFLKLNQEMRLDRGSYASARYAKSRYKVRRGDTLSSVARRHGMSVQTLARLNGISAKAKVRIGQTLTVQKSRASRQRVANRTRVKTSSVRKIRYEVKRGDTLSSIGRRYNVSVQQIKRWNGSTSKLQPGQDLLLYVARSNSRSM